MRVPIVLRPYYNFGKYLNAKKQLLFFVDAKNIKGVILTFLGTDSFRRGQKFYLGRFKNSVRPLFDLTSNIKFYLNKIMSLKSKQS